MNNLGIDLKLLIAQIINFGLFFWIFKRFIAKPFSTFLDIEINKEKDKQRVLEELKRKEEEMILKEKEFNNKMKKELDETTKLAKLSAQKVKEEIIQQARNEAEEIISRSKRQTEEDKQILYKDLKTKIGDFSILIVNRALKDLLTEEMRKNITNYILTNLSKKVNLE